MSLIKGRKRQEEEDSEGTWAISYGDLVTLLLSFFVIFFTTDIKGEKVKKMSSLMSFNIDGLTIKQSELVEKNSVGEATLDFSGLDVKVEQINEKMFVTFGEFSFFDSGKTELNLQGEAVLKEFAQKFLPYAGNFKLTIKSFTDKRQVSRTQERFKDNLELSALRSITGMRLLKSNGIPMSRMEIGGAGVLKDIRKIHRQTASISPENILALSRTIIIIISPDQESTL